MGLFLALKVARLHERPNLQEPTDSLLGVAGVWNSREEQQRTSGVHFSTERTSRSKAISPKPAAGRNPFHRHQAPSISLAILYV